MSLLTYKYYDTPEGQDIYKKVFVTSKYAALSGLALSTFDVLMYSHPKGVLKTAGRFAFYTGPFVGMASTFTLTTNVLQNYRGKNDKINYFVGGLAAGSVLGAWIRSVAVAVPIALLLGLAGIVKKTSIDDGWVFLPDNILATNSAVSVRRDWTIVKDVEELKTWTTGKE